MQVKFITNGANSAFGGFTAGDTLRCSPEMAKHLVEEIKCARYMEAPAVEPVADEPTDAPKRGRKHKSKDQA